jgi:hypothetical protein
MKCEVFGLDGSFQKTCFCHVFSFKACQHATTNEKNLEIEKCFNQIYIVKFAQMHNLAKKSKKEKKEWNKTCENHNIFPRKLNTSIETRYMGMRFLKFSFLYLLLNMCYSITLCYSLHIKTQFYSYYF